MRTWMSCRCTGLDKMIRLLSVFMVVILLLLLTSCGLTTSYIAKDYILFDDKSKAITEHLQSQRPVYARVDGYGGPVQITGLQETGRVSGVLEDGERAEAGVDDILSLWTQYIGERPVDYSKGRCDGCGPAMWVLFSVATGDPVAGLVLALGLSYAIVISASGYDDFGVFIAD